MFCCCTTIRALAHLMIHPRALQVKVTILLNKMGIENKPDNKFTSVIAAIKRLRLTMIPTATRLSLISPLFS